MIGILIISYLVAGLYFACIAACGLGDDQKTKDPILFLKVEVFLLLCWPVCLFIALRDYYNDNDKEDTDL